MKTVIFRKAAVATILTLLLTGVLVVAAAATSVIDLTTAGAVITHNGAIFLQGPLPTSSGTGVLDPFIRVSKANADIVQGYNTNYRPLQYEEDQSWTEALLLSTVATLDYEGVLYRELRLDINQVNSDPYLSLDELKLFISTDPLLHNYDPALETFSGSATKVWDMGDAWIWLDYSLQAGSGQSDATFLVPESIFENLGCDYGQLGCNYYLYVWSKYGIHHNNNDGFEEWATVVYPVVQPSKTAVASYDRTFTWTIDKAVDQAQCNLFAGESCTPEYTVTVDQTVTDSNIKVSGQIIIHNPAKMPDGEQDLPAATITSVTDVFAGFPATVTCPGGLPQTINKGTTLTCTYVVNLTSKVDGTNTATILTQGGAQPFTASAPVVFGAPTNVIGYPTIDVTDTNGEGWSASGDATWTYAETLACSTTQGSYTNGFYTYGHPNTATITQTGASSSENVTVNCYAPVVSKDAAAGYDERHEWGVVKTVDPASQSGFAGEEVFFDWTITVSEDVYPEAYGITGKIYVHNPAPMAMTVAVADVLDDGTLVSLACEGSLVIPAGETGECAYSAAPDDATATINTATVTLNTIDYAATASIEWIVNVIRGSATLDDVQYPYSGYTVDGGWTTTYEDSYVCSTNPVDYTNGADLDNLVSNTASVYSGGALEGSSTSTTEIDCYAPVVSKDAAAGYNERHEWGVVKTVNPTSQSGFAGEEVFFNWTIVVSEDIYPEAYGITGKIYVHNPAPMAMTVAVADVLDDGTPVALACEGSLVIPAGETGECAYSAAPDDATATLNTATATLNTIDYAATASIEWIVNVIRGSATLDDEQYPFSGYTVDGGWKTTYEDSYTCSTNPGDYTNGADLDNEVSNTASVYSGGALEGSSIATTEIDCYAPVVSKDAAGGYDERHTWEITKSVDPASQSGFAGEELSWTWTVSLSESFVEENYAVTGQIYVYNAAGEPMVVALADAMNDGTAATITGCTVGTYEAGSLTIPAGDTAVCGYTATPAGRAATLNTATATLNGNPFTGEAPVSFVKTVVNGSAVVDDDLEGNFPVTVYAGEGPWSWTETQRHICSADFSAYGEDGTYAGGANNTAIVTASDGQTDNASASTAYDCYAPVVSKDAAGGYDERHTWEITKSVDPASQSGFAGEELSWTWTVSLSESFVEENYAVTGQIYVYNAAGEPMVVALADAMNDGTAATITGCTVGTYEAGSLTIPAGDTAICDYTAAPAGRTATLNTATATLNGHPFTGDAVVSFVKHVVNGSAVVNDNQDGDFPVTVYAGAGPWTWTETQRHTCSADFSAYGEDGTYAGEANNTAIVTASDGQTDGASASTAYDCYAPVVSKDAAAGYDERHEWGVVKTVNPTSQSGFAGEEVFFNWTIVVSEDIYPEAFAITGKIYVHNPAPMAMTVAVADVLDDGTPVALACGGSLTIPAGGDGECAYSAAPDDATATLNTATATLNAASFGAEADINWIVNVIRGSATLDDEQYPYSGVAVNDGWTSTYEDSYVCSTNPGDYTNGADLDNEVSNTASVYSGGALEGSSTSTTEIDCYAPVVTKTADEFYTRYWNWTITKDYDGSYTMLAGESVTHGYLVTVNPTPVDNSWQVTGEITIVNPHPTEAMLLTSVSDLAGGINGLVTCASLTVPANGSLVCSYDTGAQNAPNVNPFGGTNTATAVFAAADWTGTAPIVFGAPTSEDHPVIHVSDTNGGGFSANRAVTSWPYTRDFACPTDETLYTNGIYTYQHRNVASIDETGAADDALVNVTCYWPAEARVVKATTAGPEDIGQLPFTFELYGPAGGAPVETQYLNAAGEVVFTTEMDIAGTWTVKEVLPEGWLSMGATECDILVAFPASAGQTYTCSFDNKEMSRVSVLKLTQGVPAETTPPAWTFRLFTGPDGFDSGAELAADTTPPALLDFGFIDLDPDAQYTLCETNVAAGWTSFWKVDTDGDGIADTIINPYNPNSDDNPAQDLGNRCVEIGAGTEIPLVPGDTLAFEVNNTYPGGEPRTPGYWKNWNACTGGGQYQNAMNNGGGAGGFWTLDELLNNPGFWIGNVYLNGTWNDDPFMYDSFNHNDCVEAVYLLDKSDARTGKKKASDAAYDLATALMAAKLNLAAGAETCQQVQTAVGSADTLLATINFTGTGDYLGPKVKGTKLALRNQAIQLAATLDLYNNGNLCTP